MPFISWPELQGDMTPAQLLQAMASLVDQLRFAFENMDASNFGNRIVTVTTPGTADTEFAVIHSLGQVPTGYIVIRNGNGGMVYNGATAWTSSTIYLKCTTANNSVTLLVL